MNLVSFCLSVQMTAGQIGSVANNKVGVLLGHGIKTKYVLMLANKNSIMTIKINRLKQKIIINQLIK